MAFALNDYQRDAVNKQQYIRDDKPDPTDIVNPELVDGEEFVFIRMQRIKIGEFYGNVPGVSAVNHGRPLDRYAGDQLLGQFLVAFQSARFFRPFQHSNRPLYGDIIKLLCIIDSFDCSTEVIAKNYTSRSRSTYRGHCLIGNSID